jgi:hypothetical protein
MNWLSKRFHSGGPATPRPGEVAAVLSPARVLNGPGWFVCETDASGAVTVYEEEGFVNRDDCLAEVKKLNHDNCRHRAMQWNGYRWLP